MLLAFLTIFSPTHIPIIDPRFFSAAKKHFNEEFKNGHLLHVQKQNLMRSFKLVILIPLKLNTLNSSSEQFINVSVQFLKFSKNNKKIQFIFLPFSERQPSLCLIPDFSVRLKKIPSRISKMDIYCMSKIKIS